MPTVTPVRLEDLPGIDPAESQQLATEMNEALIQMLSSLRAEEWDAITPCAPWTVKDIAAHLLGWNEALGSFKEMRSQVGRSLRRSKEFGNPTDAQNNIQVEDRKHLSPDRLIEGLRQHVPRAIATRKRFGTVLRYLPLYSSYLGGPFTAGYLINTIFLRDVLVHRLDIQEATGADPRIGAADRRVIADFLKDWARRTNADVTIVLTGAVEGTFVAGSGTRGTVTADAGDLVRLLGGRATPDVVSVDGDRTAVDRWLATPCPV